MHSTATAVGRFYSLHERLISAHKWDHSDSLDSFRFHNQRLYPEHMIMDDGWLALAAWIALLLRRRAVGVVRGYCRSSVEFISM